MHYIMSPGVVRTKVCGVTMLIPTRQAYDCCKSIRKLGILAAASIEFIEKGQPVSLIYKMFSLFMKNKPEHFIKQKVDAMLQELCESGFIIAVEDDK